MFHCDVQQKNFRRLVLVSQFPCCFIGDNLFHYSFWTASVCYHLPTETFSQHLADRGQVVVIKQVFFFFKAWRSGLLTDTRTLTQAHTQRWHTDVSGRLVRVEVSSSEPRAASLQGVWVLLLLLASRGRQSLGQEVQGGVSLLHQLGRCGVHLGAGKVVDGESVNHFPGLVLWETTEGKLRGRAFDCDVFCLFLRHWIVSLAFSSWY